MSRGFRSAKSYDSAPAQMNLHFAEFPGSTCACCPFRLSIIGKILPPALRRLAIYQQIKTNDVFGTHRKGCRSECLERRASGAAAREPECRQFSDSRNRDGCGW